MDYLKQYKSFVNSYYLAEGIRITVGITLPAIVLSYFHNLSAGIIVSIGAMCVSIPDNAGSILHRRNAMLICDALIFFVAICTGFATAFPAVLGVMIFIFCFLFAMIGVYGPRATAVGLAALFVMVLNIDRPQHGWPIIINAAYVLAGGIWYTVLSLSLYSFRPFKLAQQALGETIESTADYLRLRAIFYGQNYKRDIYDDLLDVQSRVHEKQNLVRELLFRSRNISKESTDTGRVLVMVFLDIVDLFEKVITSHQDYTVLHQFFDGFDILQRFESVILLLSDKLNEIGVAVKRGGVLRSDPGLGLRIRELKDYFEKFRDLHRSAGNVEGFISLRHILDNMEDIGDRIYSLENYAANENKIFLPGEAALEYGQFAPHDHIEPKLLFEHLTLTSDTFRHSIRLSVATLTGFFVSKFLPFSHSYWILLTIIVILKPAYGLSKKRNYHRLFGTIVGALFGFTILFFIKDKTAVFVLMILLMIGAYSFMRINYLVFVSLMTPYILLLFHLLNASNFRSVVTDRVIDTAIGSVIAFMANFFLLPSWEHERVTDHMSKMVADNLQYFLEVVAAFLQGGVSKNQYKIARKNAFVSLANLSDALNRMLSEPKSKQKMAREAHQFVVANHMLTANIATLSLFIQKPPSSENRQVFAPVEVTISTRLQTALAHFLHAGMPAIEGNKMAFRNLNDKLNDLLQRRKMELEKGILDSETKRDLSAFKPIADQFNFINKAAIDIERLSNTLAVL
jgi:uncharacterized membrane protein (TIGR01666 family)